MSDVIFKKGDKVRVILNPGKIGIVINDTLQRGRILVDFNGDSNPVRATTLELVKENSNPIDDITNGIFGGANDLRKTITFYRLNGQLANLIYSLNTTNTEFHAFQFKPVLNFLESPCQGILIADEVGLGKTIEAGLIWTELRARQDARRLLIICPAMLQEKWRLELNNRFGIRADVVNASGLLKTLQESQPGNSFALIASIQGIRPPRGWDDSENDLQRSSANLARYLRSKEAEDPIFDMIIVDEAHYLRNSETQTYELGELLRPLTENLVLLSATPIHLKYENLFNLLRLLDKETFHDLHFFEDNIRQFAPMLKLRDKILQTKLSREEFVNDLNEATEAFPAIQELQQYSYLRNNIPSDEKLASPDGRAELADQLDRMNPLSKVLTRTRKRDVQEMRVEREPKPVSITLNPQEKEFYDLVTEKISEFCYRYDYSKGLMLTIPQRQLSSCIAAACRGWQKKGELSSFEESEQEIFEMFGSKDSSNSTPVGALLQELIAIAKQKGNFNLLKKDDSKYGVLKEKLLNYWQENPGKKIVLFSFYRLTLEYLQERFSEDGIPTILVYGGVDKQEALKQFKDKSGPNLLLSSEVASEGVDLQFSSFLINYDLPWNPMNIEQRIGRIDRIGQSEEKILIRNFIYANTIDEKIHDRLLSRLDIFKNALGSMEDVLGLKIEEYGYDLLSHKLDAEEIERRANSTLLAIEKNAKQEKELESQAIQLMAHGDYIQNQVKAAQELGRYITGEDLFACANDFFNTNFKGTNFVAENESEKLYRCALSVEAQEAFRLFLSRNKIQTSFSFDAQQLVKFDNTQGKRERGIEIITQQHPLIAFIRNFWKENRRTLEFSKINAIEIQQDEIPFAISKGIYVFAVQRWNIQSIKTTEKLAYKALPMTPNIADVSEEKAELLINKCSINGKRWDGVNSSIEKDKCADIFFDCMDNLEDRFNDFAEQHKREHQDRAQQMISALQKKIDTSQADYEERKSNILLSNDDKKLRTLPMVRGRHEKLIEKLKSKIESIQLKTEIFTQDFSFVSGGVIRVI